MHSGHGIHHDDRTKTTLYLNKTKIHLLRQHSHNVEYYFSQHFHSVSYLFLQSSWVRCGCEIFGCKRKQFVIVKKQSNLVLDHFWATNVPEVIRPYRMKSRGVQEDVVKVKLDDIVQVDGLERFLRNKKLHSDILETAALEP